MGSLTLQFSPCDDFCHNPNASSLNSIPAEGSDGKPNICVFLGYTDDPTDFARNWVQNSKLR